MAWLRNTLAAGALGAALFSGTAARADDASVTLPAVPHPYAYGILVGTNAGGPGQTPLRYAEDDARKMAQVLRELGRYGTSDLRVLIKPDGKQVLAAIDDVAQKLKAHQAKGEQAILVFYYSGHAKANAFNLGSEELSVATLREKLRALPAQLTLVVLDACQSGQFARVKGAEPAADFSFNSVSRLGTKGVAVMASSSSQELSQESDELKSSYFTHHLISALRGAADADGDGKVSLDEAYRYAYRRTLSATAQTQVGSQHVTLETDLAGQGDVPVTYPAAAKSQLELPASLDARVLVQHRTSGNVVAEVQKSPGPPLKLAIASGQYDAIVRRSASGLKILKCKLALADEKVTPLDLNGCEEVKLAGVAKGDEPDRVELAPAQRRIDPWTVEAGFGLTGRIDDGYTRRLQEFGYRAERGIIEPPRARASATFFHGLLPHVSVGIGLTTLSGDTYRRTVGESNDQFSFSAFGAHAFVRASTDPFGRTSVNAPYFQLYGQLGGGLTLGVAKLSITANTPSGTETSSESHWGYMLGAAGGVSFNAARRYGIFFQLGWDYAPTLANLTGETHDAGGPNGLLGVRFRFE